MLSFIKNNRYRILLICIFILVFFLNLLQFPMTDEWAQIPKPGDEVSLYYIISRYFTYVSRVGDVFLRIFLYFFRDNIFIEQMVFGLVNFMLFVLFMLGLKFIITGTKKFSTQKEVLLGLGLFLSIYLSGHFHQSYINQPGAVTYFWAIFFALYFIITYYYWFFDKEQIIKSNIGLYLYIFFFAFFTGWSSELLGPTLFIGLGLICIIAKFVFKKKIPLWFYLGGVILLVGWCLVIFGPGHRARNGGGNLPDSLDSIQWGMWISKTLLYFLAYIGAMLPLLSISITTLLHIKKNNNKAKKEAQTIIFFICLGIICAGAGAVMLRWILPPRAWVYFSLFFIISAGFSIQYYLDNIYDTNKKLPKILATLLVFIVAIHTVELVKYRIFFTKIFADIEYQVSQGVKDIEVATPLYRTTDAYFVRWVDDIFIRSWIMDRMALYYQVDTLRFIDPITKKSYRELYLNKELKFI